jgi:hypothetical protein
MEWLAGCSIPRGAPRPPLPHLPRSPCGRPRSAAVRPPPCARHRYSARGSPSRACAVTSLRMTPNDAGGKATGDDECAQAGGHRPRKTRRRECGKATGDDECAQANTTARVGVRLLTARQSAVAAMRGEHAGCMRTMTTRSTSWRVHEVPRRLDVASREPQRVACGSTWARGTGA